MLSTCWRFLKLGLRTGLFEGFFKYFASLKGVLLVSRLGPHDRIKTVVTGGFAIYRHATTNVYCAWATPCASTPTGRASSFIVGA